MSKLENKNLYPGEQTPVLTHYNEFDSVYIGLLPFSNDYYPTDEERSHNGRKVLWNEIIKNTKLNDYKEVNKALMTSIAAFRKKLERQDLLDYLNEYCKKYNIWYPTEGAFDFFTKSSIYELLTFIGIEEVVVEDEHYQNEKTIDLTNTTKKDFCKKIELKDYYIHDKNKSILFAISWDYFFFFIAVNEQVFSRKIIESYFEGFWADEKCTHLWTWEEGEIDRLFKESTKDNSKANLLSKLKEM